MEDIRREMNVPIKAKNLKSGYEVEPRLPKIITDRERLIQILINLINNAVKYTPKGRIDIKVFRDGESIHFMVKDTGIGIDKMHSDKLFQRFYQIDSSYTRKAGGTGLGLALCKEFVTLLGGKIWFESKFGKGSKFHVTLPLIPPNFDAKAAYTRAEHAISNAGSASRRAKKLTVERRPDKQGPPTSKAPI
jgi:signal transduction histidine kinase